MSERSRSTRDLDQHGKLTRMSARRVTAPILVVVCMVTGVAGCGGTTHHDSPAANSDVVRVVNDTSTAVTAVECGPVSQYERGHPCGSPTAKQIATQQIAAGHSANFAPSPESTPGSASDYLVVQATGQPARCLVLPPESSHDFEIQVSRLTHSGC